MTLDDLTAEERMFANNSQAARWMTTDELFRYWDVYLTLDPQTRNAHDAAHAAAARDLLDRRRRADTGQPGV